MIPCLSGLEVHESLATDREEVATPHQTAEIYHLVGSSPHLLRI